MSGEPDVIRALRLQGQACRGMGSPFTATLLERAAEDATGKGATADLLAPWANLDLNRQFDAATPLRLAAALHNLALSGEEPALTAAYKALNAEEAWRAAREATPRRRDWLADFMRHEPQTNEVRRSIALLGGFLEIARVTGKPFRLFEIGASAGLNLSWDRYRYELDGAGWGDPQALVRMDTEWSGVAPPLEARVEVIERAGCDRRPTDLSDPDQRRRLLSYYWPDQTERLARIHAAIDFTLASGVQVETANAADWTRARVSSQAGAATVVYHSSFWPYLSPEGQAELRAVIEAIGERAMAEAPFAWLSLEPTPNDITLDDLRLRLWPSGEERVLAVTHPHGAWVRWRGLSRAPAP